VPLTFGDAELAMMQGLSGVSLEGLSRSASGRSGRRCCSPIAAVRAGGVADLVVLAAGAAFGGSAAGAGCGGVPAGAETVAAEAGVAGVLGEVMPARLAAVFAAEVAAERMADAPDRALLALAGRLSGWALTPTGTEGFAKAEVTCGGSIRGICRPRRWGRRRCRDCS